MNVSGKRWNQGNLSLNPFAPRREEASHQVRIAAPAGHVFERAFLGQRPGWLPSPQLAYGQVCAALGLEPEPVQVRLKRINPEPLVQLIRNWTEIEALLSPTRFAWMLAA